LACFSVVAVGFLVLRYQPPANEQLEGPIGTPGPQPTHTVTYVQITGLSQYRLAEAEARAWAEDAQLVSANAHWFRVLRESDIGQPGAWTYRFYSAVKERLLIVKVEPDGQIRSFEHVVIITLSPQLLNVEVWSIDSPAALAIWLDYGGADIVRRNPGLEVLIQLRALSNHPGPVWMVVGTDKRTQDIHIVVIDTTEGKVLSTSSSP
jgi:hypothetical protein